MNSKSQIGYFYIKVAAIVLVTIGVKFWLINNFGSQVPFWDQWAAQGADVFLPWLNENLSWANLLAPHNEHRIFLTRVLTLFLLSLNERQWDPLLEMVINAVLYSFTFLAFIFIAKDLLGKVIENTTFLLLIIIIGIIPFSWQSTLNGSQSCVYFAILFSLIALWGLIFHDFLTLRWQLGLVASVCALFSFTSGLLVFPVVIFVKLYLIIMDKASRRSHFYTVCVSFLIAASYTFWSWETFFLARNIPIKAHSISEFMLALGKSLAWPWVKFSWFSLLFYLPLFVLLVKVIWKNEKPSQGELFVLSLGLWVILQAASIAHGRGVGGRGPDPRHMDTLPFGILANTLALYLLFKGSGWVTKIPKLYIYPFMMLFFLGLYHLYQPSWAGIKNRHRLTTEQVKNTHNFVLTGDINTLKNKPTLHIPYPSPERLASILIKLKSFNTLPTVLAAPSLLKPETDNVSFITDGFHPNVGKYQKETVLGSYTATASFETDHFSSELIKIPQSFVEIPIAGHLGKEGLRLEILIEGRDEPILVTPPISSLNNNWVSTYTYTAGKPFRLRATDERTDAWFAFAMPRGVGILSMGTMWLLDQGIILFFIGIALFYALSLHQAFNNTTAHRWVEKTTC